MLSYQILETQGLLALQLTGELTIYSATQARRDIPWNLSNRGAHRLDLSCVDEIDTAGVQLLLWLKQEARRQGEDVSLIHPSASVQDVFELLGLKSALGDPGHPAPTSR